MEKVRRHHVLHNVNYLCSQELQAILLHKRMGVFQHPLHLLKESGIEAGKGRTDLHHLTQFYETQEVISFLSCLETSFKCRCPCGKL